MQLKIFRFIYNMLFYLITPILLLRLFWRSLKAPSYRQRIGERFGFIPAPARIGGIWIHTVSVGEFIAALPLIKQMQVALPNEQLIVTTTTPTGSARVKAALGDSVFHIYLPYDTAFGIKRFLSIVKPRLAIILETELWWNTIHYSAAAKIPLLLVNARLSPHAFKSYLRWRFIVQALLNKFSKVMAQSTADFDRFLQLGLDPNKLSMPGNIKYDIAVDPKQLAIAKVIKQSLGQRLVWIAASTHNDEEQQILTVFKALKQQCPELLLLLVPRHPERFELVAQLITAHGYTFMRRSTQQSYTATIDVLLGDTMGELGILYQVADLAFIGGSFVPIGGHNVLEPALAGIPIVTGPHLHNFVAITQKMLAANAMVVVQNPLELQQVLQLWLAEPALRQTLGSNAAMVVQQNQGATQKILREIQLIN